jgi:hypothetical protein
VSLVIECVAIDCSDLQQMSEFWQAALNLEQVWTGPSGGYLLAAREGSQPRLGLMPWGDEKTGKSAPPGPSPGQPGSRGSAPGTTRGGPSRHRPARRFMGRHGRPGRQRVLRLAIPAFAYGSRANAAPVDDVGERTIQVGAPRRTGDREPPLRRPCPVMSRGTTAVQLLCRQSLSPRHRESKGR